MPRLSRVASQARTRRALIGTARELFLRDGYFATSLDKVADAAGYSKGAVYSNFRSKDELCLAVLDAILAERGADIAAALAAAEDSFAAQLDAFERWADAVIGDQGWSMLEIEFGSQVRANPALRGALARRAESMRGAITLLIAAGAADAGQALPMPADELAAALLSLGLGLALQRAFDPSVSVRPLTNTIRLLAGLPAASAVSA